MIRTPSEAPSASAPPFEVDARGHRCPTPTLRLRRALARIGPGDLVILLADDPLARIDIPHFAAANGHELVSLTESQGELRALVRKAPLLLSP